MNGAFNSFTDPPLVCGLYASADRIAQRTRALHRARTSGRHAGEVIADLAAQAQPANSRHPQMADIGCGRGTTTGMLARRLPTSQLVALDRSAALLAATRYTLLHTPSAAELICGDFHNLPFADCSYDIVVAAFCLYHSPVPQNVVGEIARCLRPHGKAVLATKSADSYSELDCLVAAAELDVHANSRTSLYATAHSENLALLASAHLVVGQVIHHSHTFKFAGLADVAEYLATSPKYEITAVPASDPKALAAALSLTMPDCPVTATSTVTYVVASRPDRSS